MINIAKKALRRSIIVLGRLAARGSGADDRFALLTELGGVLTPTYRFKWPQMDWWADQPFNAFLDRFDERTGFNTDRRLMIAELVRLVENVPGDTAECGVYRGAGSFIICSANAQSRQRRAHHIFDSFEGLSSPTAADGSYWTSGDLSVGLDIVKQNLSQFSDVHFHKGWIPERFADVADRQFAFVHVDVDLMEPTRDSVAFFYPRLADGAILLCDDYGFTTCPGATSSIDEFLADKPEKMIRLADGGGFFIKGRTTAASAFGGSR